jgi:uncharacterized membrane protein YhaH (DUF805 family)
MGDFNPFTFAGRLGRLQFFGFSVIWALSGAVVALVSGIDFESSADPSLGGILFALVFFLVALVASLSYAVRRFHDFDKSGWWVLLYLVPVVNFVMGLILLFAPGTPGPNTYGVRSRQLPRPG